MSHPAKIAKSMRRLGLISAATGRPSYTQTMPREGQSAAVARHMVRIALDTWHLGQLAEAGALIVSELVANAARHARGDSIRVTVTRLSDHRVRVAVVDLSRKWPQRRAPDLADPHGRGLLLIEGVSVEWGCDPLPWGKRVWADLPDAV
ncbi:ATP-binding protein [Streptomyces buecherae]|uniref:ATP-binding protein n=1 Tax=Streptomyces buecherae TaxID=2763006 RepID=UPI0033E0D255